MYRLTKYIFQTFINEWLSLTEYLKLLFVYNNTKLKYTLIKGQKFKLINISFVSAIELKLSIYQDQCFLILFDKFPLMERRQLTYLALQN